MAAIFPLSTDGAGECLGEPDVCWTPVPGGSPIAVPYANVALLIDARHTSTKVRVQNKKVLHLGSEIPRSQGNEPATGGLVSGTTRGRAIFKKGSTKVRIEGRAAVYLTSTTGQNGSNANVPEGMQVLPSQQKVLISS